jgi:UDP-N-acetylmuramate dehydrogenase
MSQHTSWRVGGPADLFYRPDCIADLAAFLRETDYDVPLVWVGLGSNLLVRDGGIRGIVIFTIGCLNQIESLGNTRVLVEAGVTSAKVARFCAAQDLHGAEFLAGIPGSMGGALAMNAGAFGSETWEIVESVETLDRQGNLHQRTRDDFDIGYRHVKGADQEWFVSATLKLEHGVSEESRNRVRSLLDKRNLSQPIGTANAGSVFKNPPHDHAARLIESCGLKGYCHGAACVSDKHANFILNKGGASAADIEALIAHVRQTVAEQAGVELETEVRIIGETAQ